MKLILGYFAPPLKEQLAGVPISEKDIDQFEADAKALSHLHIRGLVTSAEVDRARKRLMDRIGKAVNK